MAGLLLIIVGFMVRLSRNFARNALGYGYRLTQPTEIWLC